MSGRKIGTGERWFRGALAPLDLIPGVDQAKKFVTLGRAGKLYHAANMGQKLTTSAANIRTSIGNTVETAKLAGNKRIAQLKSFASSRVTATGRVLEEGLIDTGRVIDKGVTSVRQACAIINGDLGIDLENSQEWYHKEDMNIFYKELEQQLELRIPDKFLEYHGWK